jgi:hypothetical protein
LIRQLGQLPQNPPLFDDWHCKYLLSIMARILMQAEQLPHASSFTGERQFNRWASRSARVHFPTPRGPANIMACGTRFCSIERFNISTARLLPMKFPKVTIFFIAIKPE